MKTNFKLSDILFLTSFTYSIYLVSQMKTSELQIGGSIIITFLFLYYVVTKIEENK